MKKTIVLFFTVLMTVFYASTSFADTPAAGGKDAVMQQIKDIDTQLAQVRADMQKLYFQKTGLNDQVTALREQKHISKLNIKQQELNAKLQAAQAKKDSAKIEELNGKITALNQELSLQNDILALLGQLSSADASSNKDTAKVIEAQIQEKRNAIKALYPKPVVTANTPAGQTMTAKPASSTVAEDSDIQALLDQIKVIDGQIKADKDKMAALKTQREKLKEQLKYIK